MSSTRGETECIRELNWETRSRATERTTRQIRTLGADTQKVDVQPETRIHDGILFDDGLSGRSGPILKLV
jgi:hypothetical protein